MPAPAVFTAELCPRTRFSLAEILVLAGTAGAGGMAPPASSSERTPARTSARGPLLVQEHSSHVGLCLLLLLGCLGSHHPCGCCPCEPVALDSGGLAVQLPVMCRVQCHLTCATTQQLAQSKGRGSKGGVWITAHTDGWRLDHCTHGWVASESLHTTHHTSPANVIQVCRSILM